MGCHFLLQGGLPDPGTEPESPAAPALAGRFVTTEPDPGLIPGSKDPLEKGMTTHSSILA